jgi:hypothetical protein
MLALKGAMPLQGQKKESKQTEVPSLNNSVLDTAQAKSNENLISKEKDSKGERFENDIDTAPYDIDDVGDEESDVEKFGNSMCTCKTARFFPHRALRCAIRQTKVVINTGTERIKAASLDVANQTTGNLAALKENEEDFLEEENYDSAIRL